MVHPLFRLAAARPQLLAEHVLAYSDLMAEELTATATLLKRRVALQLVGLAAFAVALVLAGVAAMLWAALPAGSLNVPWMLVLTPALPAAIGWAALVAGNGVAGGEMFAALRQQLSDDAAMLRGAGEA